MRASCPRRPLSWTEAERIAERQAGVLRRELKLDTRPTLPASALLDLPFLTVTYRDGFPTSGMATKTGLGWVVVIRGDEPKVRQRFSLAHELKHIIDDDLMTDARGRAVPRDDALQRRRTRRTGGRSLRGRTADAENPAPPRLDRRPARHRRARPALRRLTIGHGDPAAPARAVASDAALRRHLTLQRTAKEHEDERRVRPSH